MAGKDSYSLLPEEVQTRIVAFVSRAVSRSLHYEKDLKFAQDLKSLRLVNRKSYHSSSENLFRTLAIRPTWNSIANANHILDLIADNVRHVHWCPEKASYSEESPGVADQQRYISRCKKLAMLSLCSVSSVHIFDITGYCGPLAVEYRSSRHDLGG